MTDAVGGARRCSRVQASRYCAKCKRKVASGHKFVWIPVNKMGYYRLQHRNCGFPDCYDHEPSHYHKVMSVQGVRLWGNQATPEQVEFMAQEQPE
jgi:hypothetical protein